MDAGDVLTLRIHDPHGDMWILQGCGKVETGVRATL